MKTNIFLNSYQQHENKLTYSFFSVLELINESNLFDFLTQRQTTNKPLIDIKTVYGGGETNPDGSFDIRLLDNNIIRVYYENKTNRRGLDLTQLTGHLRQCNDNDLLLVTTPKKSDQELIKRLNDHRVVFKTWQEISLFLKTNFPENLIAQQFVDYGKRTGEFDELGEIYHDDIKTYCEYNKINFDKKIESIFLNLNYELNLSKFGFNNIKTFYQDEWGRKGLEFNLINENSSTYGQFGAISLYYDTEDHAISQLKDLPEIAFFFDVKPSKKQLLQTDEHFIELIKKLENEGFESNLNNEKTPNEWRLLYYRKPITEFNTLNTYELLKFIEKIIGKIISNKGTTHKYFSEL